MIGSMFRKAWYSDSATLNLDFTTGVLDSRLTFTRSSTGTYIDSSGYVASASTDVPRFDHDPTTLAPRGLLIEGQATNLAANSNLQGGWLGGSNTTVTANTSDVLSPDGTNNAAKVALTSAGYCSRFEAISGLAASTTYTFSYWIRGTAGNQQRVYSVTAAADLVTQSTLTYTSTGWTRVQITFTTGASGPVTVYVYVASRPTGTASDVLYIWGAQVEAGSFASSLIPTSGSTATRDPDNCVMTGTDFSSWFNASEGTFFAEYKGVPSGYTDGIFWQADDGTDNQRLFLSNATGNPRNRVVDGGSTQCSLTYSSVLMTSDGKNAFAYAANDFAGSTNGGTVLTDTVGTVPSVNQMSIGSLRSTSSYINTAISQIKFWPTRLPDATLQSLTT
jgi:hypothetical protein